MKFYDQGRWITAEKQAVFSFLECFNFKKTFFRESISVTDPLSKLHISHELSFFYVFGYFNCNIFLCDISLLK